MSSKGSSKVMLVDDSSYMRGILKKILKGAGYEEFVEASDGGEAVDTFRKERPDIVLMDIVMPSVNGLDALREIKHIDRNARVIMVTAVGQDVIMEEATEAGAGGFIVKPFEASQVREAVNRTLVGGPS